MSRFGKEKRQSADDPDVSVLPTETVGSDCISARYVNMDVLS